MIKTTRQLKDKINNLSDGNAEKAQTLFRNYMMERFLERVSLSDYKNNFILKGGMLVASLVGLDMRATMDIDSTITSLSLSVEEAKSVVEFIISIKLDDNVSFEITDAETIMDEFDYPGVRIKLNAYFENSRQPIKLDISTGDVITPSAVHYEYPLMFENRTISVMSYNIETLLAEKLQTIMVRAETNTRMRDYYDVYIIVENEQINYADLSAAFNATCKARNSENQIKDIVEIYTAVAESETMKKQWDNYKSRNFYVGDISWESVSSICKELILKITA
ncbi:nucleotidyl transferase AbiEii/AbiGii toxin family protein [bacterium]|nr:nucleotidyl transferase AbiEii/AbiGii toxin family protein [Eubacterium sp.]MBR1372989.1 nucleotidyl transferase AbiEii/AbiGii toxin family protein [bacterium]